MQKSHDIRILSQTAEHALRALLYLAQQDLAVPASEIASAIGAPANYLSKTLQVLARNGMVAATRGPSGGFRLAWNPAEITVLDVASLFAERAQPQMCMLGGALCSAERACATHEHWTAMRSSMLQLLNEQTVAGLLGDDALCLHATATQWN
jgi:Rrf2 family iron-sulfur cluster assembly transcriptional regulator